MTIGFQNFLIISSIQSSKGDFMIEDLLELVGRQRENCQNYVKMLKLERNRITVMLVILHLFVAVLIFLMGYIFCKLQSFEFMMRAIYLCTHFGTFVNIFTSEAMNHVKFQLLLFLSNLIRSLSAFLKKKTVKVLVGLTDTRQEKKFTTRQSGLFWPVPSTDQSGAIESLERPDFCF